MTFDKSGQLRMAIFIGNGEELGNISKAQAVRISLKEIRSGRYNILEFDNKQYYEVYVEKIPYEIINSDINFSGFIFLVDTDTGECALVDHDP